MNGFLKYLLINLLIFVPIVILIYWITKPSGEANAVSSTVKQRFLADTDEASHLYNQFKKSVETNDLSQREQDKVNLEQQISIMETAYETGTAFGQIASKVEQNYKRLITLHIAASDNNSEIGKRKDDLQKEIQALEAETSTLAIRLAILKSQPVPSP